MVHVGIVRGIQFSSYGFKPLQEHLTFQGTDGKNDSVSIDAFARMIKYGLAFNVKFLVLTNCHSQKVVNTFMGAGVQHVI